ncbi:hypothetical protein Y032_0006g3012 [Ancylostoma ceylanicum]|uniref:Uncharacterized protein n=1 Tax=Ancylostoma ceylanicum TaxID=53326 RepID=A0A016VRX4_9BILA|nr:hypothetical protein Y032_0006g3012 [Ancylostoma ceylanicum]
MRSALLLYFFIYSAYGRRPIEHQTQEEDFSSGDVRKSGLQHLRSRRSPPKDIDDYPDPKGKRFPVNIVMKDSLKGGKEEKGFWTKVKDHVVGLYDGVKKSVGKVADGISTLWKDNNTPEVEVDSNSEQVRRKKSIKDDEYKLPAGLTPPWNVLGQPNEKPVKKPWDPKKQLPKEPFELHSSVRWRQRTKNSEPEETTMEEVSTGEFVPELTSTPTVSAEKDVTEFETTEEPLIHPYGAPWNRTVLEEQNSAQSKNRSQTAQFELKPPLNISLLSLGPMRKQTVTTKAPTKSRLSTETKFTSGSSGPTEPPDKIDKYNIAPWSDDYQPYLERDAAAEKSTRKPAGKIKK